MTDESADMIKGGAVEPDTSAEGDMTDKEGGECTVEAHHERLAAHEALHKSHHERLLALEGGMSDTNEEDGDDKKERNNKRRDREERMGRRKRH